MNNTENKEAKNISQHRMHDLFVNTPVWKSVLKMSIPGFFIMLIMGIYNFSDSILSINLASDYYANSEQFQFASKIMGGDGAVIRMFMSSTQVISTLIFAISFMFAMGIGSRVAVNMGRGNIERAKNTIRVGTMYGSLTMVLLIPILLMVSKSWMTSQYGSEYVAEGGYNYARIIIIVAPIVFFNNTFTLLLRNEGINKALLISQICPMLLNLFMDWIFMGPAGMGVEGGAIATMIAYLVTFGLLQYFAYRSKSELIKWNVMLGFKMKSISIIGILIVGLSPFLRNMSNAITQTMTANAFQDISQSLYGNNVTLNVINSGVFPIYVLAFPAMFGILQGARPVASYNYGNKNFDNVKKIFWVSALYAFIIGLASYLIFSFILVNPLLDALNIHNTSFDVDNSINHIYYLFDSDENLYQGLGLNKESMLIFYKEIGIEEIFNSAGSQADFVTGVKNNANILETIKDSLGSTNMNYRDIATNAIRIILISVPLFAFAISGMMYFASTDRTLLAIISATFQGILLYIPILFIFKEAVVVVGPDFEYLVWFMQPTITLTSSIIVFILAMINLKTLTKKQETLDEKLHRFYERFSKNKVND